MRSVIGTTVNAAGLTLAKWVPRDRLDRCQRVGVGASPSWHLFCIDGAIAWVDPLSAVGDLRLRIDADALRELDDDLAWAPAEYFEQDGTPSPYCARGLLRSVERRLADAGLTAKLGHELEFVLVGLDGSALTDPVWTPYGATGLLEHERFIADLMESAAAAGLRIEQLHSEYGPSQFEFSLPPLSPVAAADTVVLAKILVGRVARRYDLRASFSPMPFAGGAGNGAHQHFSLLRDGQPLFGGGDGPHGLTTAGGAAVGGILDNLPDIQGLLTGSVVSGLRLGPGQWSGVHRCWGLENREAAVRLIADGPDGTNVEVKVVDPSANVYLASSAILAAALDGIASQVPLPPEIADDPSKRSEQIVDLLPSDAATVVDALDSPVARTLLNDQVVDATVATRRHEQVHHGNTDPDELARRFRLSWSI